MKNYLLLTLLSIATIGFAQTQPPATTAADRLQGYENKKALEQNTLIQDLPFRSVGPTVFSGRVVDIAVSPKDPSHFYVAYASGGLWKTENNGMSFVPLFDQEAVMTIGDIAVDWERNIIWIGTGENNASRSSYAGLGMYRSEDGGKTWSHKGLEESHHIGRIILHPSNPDILWVASLGHLYSSNEERGVYKTTDGGQTWNKTLFVDDNSGAIELVVEPSNPDVLYAATWHRERRAWDFVESGKGSGIHKSTDGGETWKLLSTGKSGFPTGEGVGRIGLAINEQEGKTVLYAVLDNYNRRPKEKEEDTKELSKDELRTMSKTAFLQLDKKKVAGYLKANRFPKKYSADKVIEMLKADKIQPSTLVEFTEDANSLLFDTPVIGAEVYRSDNGGQTWKKTHNDYLDAVYNSYGYYFGQIRVSPSNPDKVVIYGVPIILSEDGGKTWNNILGDNVHVDHHALWMNPTREGHFILGNDGGIHLTYDDGKHWIKCNSPAVGQFYAVAVDMAEPYNIYGGLQDNGVWVGPSTYKASDEWHGTGHYPYKELIGGDGMQVQIDTRDNNTVYTGFQFGFYFRVDKATGDRTLIKPKHDLGDRPLRFNWQTPIHLSIHNQDILYFGSNKLHRSFNQGTDWQDISADLTKGGKKGDVAFGTITTIHESPLQFGLLYVGTDDGLIHISKDGGFTWQQITEGLPADLWVTRVSASAHEKGRVYASLNGYRWDDFAAYNYVSEDYGATWTAIGKDLPLEPVNTLEEDPENPDLLYIGTDNGLYISLDRGQSFMLADNGLPAVAVHDIVVHPREKDLIVGTHGRSIYVADIALLQGLNAEILAKDFYVYELESVKYNTRQGKKRWAWGDIWEKKIPVSYFTKNGGSTTLKIKTKSGVLLKTIQNESAKGLNYMDYDLSIDESAVKKYEKWLNEDVKDKADHQALKAADSEKYYLQKGEYDMELSHGGKVEKKVLVIE